VTLYLYLFAGGHRTLLVALLAGGMANVTVFSFQDRHVNRKFRQLKNNIGINIYRKISQICPVKGADQPGSCPGRQPIQGAKTSLEYLGLCC
jgi:hypothetical protein